VQRPEVRPLRAEDVQLLRALRLAALEDSPEQFGETLTFALARSDEEWHQMVANFTPPSPQAVYVALLDARAVGLVFATDDLADDYGGRVGGLWVAPQARGKGIGEALVRAGLSWARGANKLRVRLWVVPDTFGERLYRRVGFFSTGNQKCFPGDESRRIEEFQYELE